MKRSELVQAIGEHVLSVFEEYTEAPHGKSVVVPIEIPRKRSAKEFKILFPNFSNWIITCQVSAPTLQMHAGNGDYKMLTAREYFKIIERLK